MRIPVSLVVILILFGNSLLFAQSKKGIGISFTKNDTTGIYWVSIVNAGNAAADAGLRVGDELLAIDNHELSKLKIDTLAALLRGGAEGIPYTLLVKRKIQTTLGEKTKELQLQITPREVAAQTCLSGDCKNGTGNLMDNATGELREGKFRDGVLIEGKTYYKSGRIRAEGTFKDGQLDGKDCTFYYDQSGNAVQLKGKFLMGILREGVASSSDGKTVKDGTFDENGVLHGKNIKLSFPGFVYEGSCIHGKLTGEAETMSCEGGRYSGPVTNAKPDGKGVLVIGKTKYKGNWKNGKREGKFRVINKMGGTFEEVHHYADGVRVR